MTHAGEATAPTAADLGRVISNPTARAAVYGVFVLALVGVGACTVGFAAVGLELPSWVVVANAVLGYLGIPVGGLAIANTPRRAL